MSDLLHSALLRSQLQSNPPETLTPAQLASLSLSESDDELIPVKTPLPTQPNSAASSRASSRAPSPTRGLSASGLPARPRSGAGKPRRDKTKEKGGANAAGKLDPLSRFPGEVNVRIFGVMDPKDLLSCGLVSKKWRKSQTINWVWHCLLQSIIWDSNSTDITRDSASSLPTWRRGDSKVDWAARYASIHRDDPALKVKESEVDEDGRTFQEEREEKWKEENEERDRAASDKGAQREYYKSLGNSKIKGKSGKGMARTWEDDGIGGGGEDYI